MSRTRTAGHKLTSPVKTEARISGEERPVGQAPTTHATFENCRRLQSCLFFVRFSFETLRKGNVHRACPRLGGHPLKLTCRIFVKTILKTDNARVPPVFPGFAVKIHFSFNYPQISPDIVPSTIASPSCRLKTRNDASMRNKYPRGCAGPRWSFLWETAARNQNWCMANPEAREGCRQTRRKKNRN